MNEEEVLEWLILQKNSATIEEVTDEILVGLIEEHEYVVVYFTGACEEGQKCDKILDELENIDDELDEAGIIFVTTEDTGEILPSVYSILLHYIHPSVTHSHRQEVQHQESPTTRILPQQGSTFVQW